MQRTIEIKPPEGQSPRMQHDIGERKGAEEVRTSALLKPKTMGL